MKTPELYILIWIEEVMDFVKKKIRYPRFLIIINEGQESWTFLELEIIQNETFCWYIRSRYPNIQNKIS